MKASVVIGANYGDEGKGLVTDYLASKGPSVVVRFNGGAQAGHTVVTPEGKRHVFHHVGAGALAGASTFLSRFFVCSPMVFAKEVAELHKLGANTNIFVDMMCPVTTPYDIMLNQAIEAQRGDARHGSCGMGFNETIQRHSDFPFRVSVSDLDNRHRLSNSLKFIRDRYVPRRMEELNLTGELKHLKDNGVLEHFLDDCEKFNSLTFQKNFESYMLNDYTSNIQLIFEGAQGLMLDMEHDNFPHVTRSKTGLDNVMTIAAECDIPSLDAYYVSRSYVTRHGAGPLLHELPSAPSRALDLTNVHNEHQGPLRYASVNPLDMAKHICDDWDNWAGNGITVNSKFVLTCSDQTEGRVNVAFGDERAYEGIPADVFAQTMARMVRGKHALISSGPTRATIKELYL